MATVTQPKGDDAGLVSSWRGWLIGALLVGGLVVAVLHWGEVKNFAKLISTAKPMWLAIAAALQIATYFGLSAQWWLALHRARTPRPHAALFRLTFAKHFADQVVPTGGVSGNVLVVDNLVKNDVPRGNAVAALLLQIIAYYLSYSLGALWVLVDLWWKDRMSWLLAGAVLAFLVVATAIPALILWLHKRGQGKLPKLVRRWSKARDFFELVGEAPAKLIRDPQLIGMLTVLNLAVFIADAATMQACIKALGVEAPLSAGYVAFMMASIAVILGPVPMGLGSFEAVSVAMLRLFGVPFEAAVSATLLFRGFTLWLPLIPGGLLLRSEMKSDDD
ncbi:lysylphosphatidylglycerol synthase transmembrane domain-containing protein [Sphingomonas sp.]|uniref:lysylphosphatidylglycerol synthase transmembrane domain-containing protein n=1 Tax=Sphingomonas sp. TaxID=28214 RepID=UPI0025EB45D6|nr:lysylphosphatidylglycerol synthase transmembrane domain-containing protein [Sphingomonas sp.]MBV9528667.1 flippase-like domain-containing protein [Sphingomonas sp.]